MRRPRDRPARREVARRHRRARHDPHGRRDDDHEDGQDGPRAVGERRASVRRAPAQEGRLLKTARAHAAPPGRNLLAGHRDGDAAPHDSSELIERDATRPRSCRQSTLFATAHTSARGRVRRRGVGHNPRARRESSQSWSRAPRRRRRRGRGSRWRRAPNRSSAGRCVHTALSVAAGSPRPSVIATCSSSVSLASSAGSQRLLTYRTRRPCTSGRTRPQRASSSSSRSAIRSSSALSTSFTRGASGFGGPSVASWQSRSRRRLRIRQSPRLAAASIIAAMCLRWGPSSSASSGVAHTSKAGMIHARRLSDVSAAAGSAAVSSATFASRSSAARRAAKNSAHGAGGRSDESRASRTAAPRGPSV